MSLAEERHGRLLIVREINADKNVTQGQEDYLV